MIRRPPGPPLFPYTPLFRPPAGLKANLPGGGDSDISLDPQTGAIAETDLWLGSATVSTSTDKGQTWTANPLEGVVVQDRQWVRSEEHTSELQSQSNLVCRLL